MSESNRIIKKAVVSSKDCVACGSCVKVCPKNAIKIENGSYAKVDHSLCVGCKSCQRACPALAITMEGETIPKQKKEKRWNEYLWIVTITYLVLGFFNILFAWLGLICFFIPLLISIFSGTKLYCNKYCGRGQLLDLIGNKGDFSLKQDTPEVLRSKWFRYGFLLFFLAMFVNVIIISYLVYINAGSLKQVVTLFWITKVPWGFAYNGIGSDWVNQFAFGFYSLMLTSTLIGLIVMILYKPRTWCVFCPMGTLTQLICKLKNGGKKIDDKCSRSCEECSACKVQSDKSEEFEDIGI